MRAVVLCALVCGCGQSVSFPAKGNWPAASVPTYVHQARFAVTDNLSDELSYVDATQPLALGNVPVGDNPVELEGPHHLAASPDGKYIYYNLSNYVPGTGSGPHGSHGTGSVPGSLVKLDAATNENLGEAQLDPNPGDVILSKDGRYAFVSHYDLLLLQQALFKGVNLPEAAYSAVAIVETATMTRLSKLPVCPTAHGEGLSADGNTLYVTCANSDELAVIDVSDKAHPTITTRVHVGPTPGTLDQPSYSPYALSVSPSDGSVWVSDNRSGDVRVFDPTTMQMNGKSVAVGGVAMFSSFTPDGATIVVPHQGDDKVTSIDTQTLATRVLPLPTGSCLNAHAFVLGPDGIHAVLVCEGDHVQIPGSIVWIDVQAFAVLGSVKVGMFSDGAAWLPPL